MSSFDEREKGFENKFAYDEEVRFKIASRRRKLLGLWAAEAMGYDDEKSLNYAMEIVTYGIDDKTPGAVIKKIYSDAQSAGITLSEKEIKSKNSEFEIIANKQIVGNKK